MKFDEPGIIGYHAGGVKTDSFARLTKIRTIGSSYDVQFIKSDGRHDFWCISAAYAGDFIEIGGVRYEGGALEAFCETFILMTETENAIDSL